MTYLTKAKRGSIIHVLVELDIGEVWVLGDGNRLRVVADRRIGKSEPNVPRGSEYSRSEIPGSVPTASRLY